MYDNSIRIYFVIIATYIIIHANVANFRSILFVKAFQFLIFFMPLKFSESLKKVDQNKYMYVVWVMIT